MLAPVAQTVLATAPDSSTGVETSLLASFAFAVLLPIGVAALLLGLFWGLKRLGGERAWLVDSIFGIVLGGAFLHTFIVEIGVPTFPPGLRAHWLGLAAGAVVLLAIPATLLRRRETPGFELFALAWGVLFACLPFVESVIGPFLDDPDAAERSFKPLFYAMTTSEHAVVALLLAGGWFVLARLADARPGPTVPLALWLSFCGLAVIGLACASWISLGFLSLTLAGVAFVAAMATLLTKALPRSIGAGGAFAAVTFLVLVPVAAFFQGEHGEQLAWWHVALIAGAPAVLLLFENRLVATLPNWAQMTVRLGAVAALVGAGAWFAYAATNTSSNGDGGPDAYGEYDAFG